MIVKTYHIRPCHAVLMADGRNSHEETGDIEPCHAVPQEGHSRTKLLHGEHKHKCVSWWKG